MRGEGENVRKREELASGVSTQSNHGQQEMGGVTKSSKKGKENGPE